MPPRVVESLSAGLVKSHTVEVYVYEQLVGDKEAALYFKRMPAFGVYTVFWQPPTPSRDADKDGLNIRIKNRNLLSSILKERSIFRNESDVVPAAFGDNDAEDVSLEGVHEMRAPRSASGAELDGRRSPSGAELDGRHQSPKSRRPRRAAEPPRPPQSGRRRGGRQGQQWRLVRFTFRNLPLIQTSTIRAPEFPALP
jgi:hypothetical protein